VTSTIAPVDVRIASSQPLYAETHDWLIDEAALLDERRFTEWLELLDPRIRYTMPVRQSGEQPGTPTEAGYFHFDENAASLDLRVRRLEHTAWAEEPFTRTRRFLTNLRVNESENGLRVESYLLVMCSRQASPEWEMLSCRRLDHFQRSEAGPLKLLRREIEIDQVVLGLTTLSIFF
jgi:3-phenylpropionate/cinnamic acid dioxygenase small subunit